MIVFLGGPIQYALRGDGFDSGVRKLIASLHEVLTEAGLTVLSGHIEERFGEVDLSGEAAYVTRRDFDWMQKCDVYVCVIPPGDRGRPYRSDGLCVELGWASALAKPAVLVWEPSMTHSHLITGLGAIADVRYLPIRLVIETHALVLDALKSPLAAE